MPGSNSGYEDWFPQQRIVRFGIAFDFCTGEIVDVPFMLHRGASDDRIAVYRARENIVYVGSTTLPNNENSVLDVAGTAAWNPSIAVTLNDYLFGRANAGPFDMFVWKSSESRFYHFLSSGGGEPFGSIVNTPNSSWQFSGVQNSNPAIPFTADINADGFEDLCAWFPDEAVVKYRPGLNRTSWGAQRVFRNYSSHIKEALSDFSISVNSWTIGAVGVRADNMAPPDSDGDGVPNCDDGCPDNAMLTQPGLCGCSTDDDDNDGTLNFLDECPTDPNKTVAGQCGCFVPETGDSDMDGTPDCNDGCPNDPMFDQLADCDCNGNGTPGDQDFATGSLTDCNMDGVADQPGCGSSLSSASRYWIASIGQFSDAANWCSPAVGSNPVPGPTNDAVFEFLTNADVDVTTNTSVRSLRVDSSDVLVNLGTRSLSTFAGADALRVGSTDDSLASLTLLGARLNTQQCVLGGGSGSVSSVLVTDSGAGDIASFQELIVGEQGEAAIFFDGLLSVSAGQLSIGSTLGGRGDVVLQDSNLSVSLSNLNLLRGSLSVEGGSTLNAFRFGVAVSDEGVLRGDASIIGPVSNVGEIRPGDSAQSGASALGTLTLSSGLYRQVSDGGTRTGSMVVDISGVATTLDSDRLVVNGQVDLAGGLLVNAVAGFDPAIGSSVEILSATSNQTGSRFDVALLPGLSPAPDGTGRQLRVTYGSPASLGSVSIRLVVDTLSGDITSDPAQNFDVDGSPADAAIDDLNGDGAPDLAVVIPNGAAAGDLVLLFNAGNDLSGNWLGFSSTLQYAVGVEPAGIDIGNVDSQGGLDIAVSNSADGTVQIFTNDGLGLPSSFVLFRALTLLAQPTDIAFGNLDNNGFDDLAVVETGRNEITVFQDQGGAPYTPGASTTLTTSSLPASVLWSNLDNDKWDDLAVAINGAGLVEIFSNTGLGVIDPTPAQLDVGEGPVQVIAADFDLDGFPDLATVNTAGNSVSMLRSIGSGNFAPSVDLPVGASPRSIVAINLDTDELDQSDPDLAVVVQDGPANVIEVLRNDYDPLSDQLVFAPATTLGSGGDPALVLASDLNMDSQEGLVTVNDDSASPLPRTSIGAPPTNEIGVLLRSAVPSQPCPGDTNGDGTTGTADITFVVSNLGAGSLDATGTPGDANGDGVTDVSDITFVVSNLGCVQ